MLLIDRRSFEARSARGARDGHIFVRCADVGALRRQRRVGLVRGLERLLKRIGQRRAGQEQQPRAAEKGNSWLHASTLPSSCGGADGVAPAHVPPIATRQPSPAPPFLPGLSRSRPLPPLPPPPPPPPPHP